jgi:hypothetical protein
MDPEDVKRRYREAMLKVQAEKPLTLGAVLCDMHGKAFNYAPDIPFIKWDNWIAFRIDDFVMPNIEYIGSYVYCNKYLCVVAEGVAMAKYDNRWVMIGTFEVEEITK